MMVNVGKFIRTHHQTLTEGANYFPSCWKRNFWFFEKFHFTPPPEKGIFFWRRPGAAEALNPLGGVKRSRPEGERFKPRPRSRRKKIPRRW